MGEVIFWNAVSLKWSWRLCNSNKLSSALPIPPITSTISRKLLHLLCAVNAFSNLRTFYCHQNRCCSKSFPQKSFLSHMDVQHLISGITISCMLWNILQFSLQQLSWRMIFCKCLFFIWITPLRKPSNDTAFLSPHWQCRKNILYVFKYVANKKGKYFYCQVGVSHAMIYCNLFAVVREHKIMFVKT